MPTTLYFSEDYLAIRLAVYSRMMLDKVCNSESLPVPGKGSPCCRCGPLLAKLNVVSTWEGSNVFVRRRQVRSTKFSIQFQRITITLSILHPPGEDLVSDADPESALDFGNNFASHVPLGQSFQCLRNRFQCNLVRNGWSDLPDLYQRQYRHPSYPWAATL